MEIRNFDTKRLEYKSSQGKSFFPEEYQITGYIPNLSVYADAFIGNYVIETSDKDISNIKVVAKEYYDQKQRKTETGIEVIFKIPRSRFSTPPSPNGGPRSVIVKLIIKERALNSKGKIAYEANVPIIINTNPNPNPIPGNYEGYINENTFRAQPWVLKFPEEVTLTTTCKYIDERLFLSADSNGGYRSIIDKIKRYKEGDTLTKIEKLNFFSLLYFSKPYLQPNSFFNTEASALDSEINKINLIINTLPNGFTRDSLTNRRDHAKLVFNNYTVTKSNLEDIVRWTEDILFENTIKNETNNSPIKKTQGRHLYASYIFEENGFVAIGIKQRIKNWNKLSLWANARYFYPRGDYNGVGTGPVIIGTNLKVNYYKIQQTLCAISFGPGLIIDDFPAKKNLSPCINFEPSVKFNFGKRVEILLSYSLDYSFLNKDIYNGINLGFGLTMPNKTTKETQY